MAGKLEGKVAFITGTPFLPIYAAEPEDIANAVAFLASDDARLITAEHLSIDQGAHSF